MEILTFLVVSLVGTAIGMLIAYCIIYLWENIK